MTPYAATFAEKKAVQCAIMENLSRNKGVMDPDLKAYPEPELGKNKCTLSFKKLIMYYSYSWYVIK